MPTKIDRRAALAALDSTAIRSAAAGEAQVVGVDGRRAFRVALSLRLPE